MAIRGDKGEVPTFRYRFGDAEFDEVRMELHVAGLNVELENKPLQVLAYLLAHADEVVTRQELFDSVWAGRITVDHVLSNTIVKLRKALGDVEGARVVTVQRSGYKLVGPVERVVVGRRLLSRINLNAGEKVPGREHFVLQAQIGASPGSEVWLAIHAKTHERRVYKFSPDGERLGSLKREATLYRVLREGLGERDDIVRIIDWNFESPPFYLECEYAGQNLATWAAKGDALQSMSREQRIALFLQIADAVAAAHSVGVLHKDIKPGNVLIETDAAGHVRARVSDFGSGRLLEPGRLEELGITQLGFTLTQNLSGDSSSGTPLYMAPELLAGHSPTVQSDVYALGLMLYQLLISDMRRPLVPGWESGIDDDLLCEDILAATNGDIEKRLRSAADLTIRIRSYEQRKAERFETNLAIMRARDAEKSLARTQSILPWAVATFIFLAIGLVSSLLLYKKAGHERDSALRAQIDLRRETQRAQATSRAFSEFILSPADPGWPKDSYDPRLSEIMMSIDRRQRLAYSGDAMMNAASNLLVGQFYAANYDYIQAEARLRSALQYFTAEAGPDDEATIEVKYVFVPVLAKMRKFEEAEKILDEADKAMGEKLKSPSRLSLQAELGHSWYLRERYKNSEAIEHLFKAEDIRRIVDSENRLLFFKVRYALASCNLQLGLTSKTKSYLKDLEGEEFSLRQIGPHYWAGVQLMNAQILLNEGRAVEAESLELKVYELVSAIAPNSVHEMLALSELAEISRSLSKWDAALRYSSQAYRLVVAINGQNDESALREKGRLALTEFMVHRNADSIEMLERARKSLVDLYDVHWPLCQLLGYYLAVGKLERNEIEQARQLFSTLDGPSLTAASSGAPGWAERLEALRKRLSGASVS